MVLGYKPEEVIGKSVMEFVFPDDIPLAKKALLKAAQDLPHIKIYIRIIHSDKLLVLMEVEGSALMDDQGKLSTILLACKVMESIMPLEKYLFESEGLLNLIFENAVDGIKMGGTIWATSKPGVGSSFFFTLATA